MKNEIKLRGYSAKDILVRQFKNPLLLVFLVSTIVAYIFNQKAEAIAIWLIMIISVTLGFWNEYHAEKIVSDLLKKISYSAMVIRGGVKEIIPVKEVRLGDIVVLSPGAIIPADVKISAAGHLEIDEALLTGESLSVTKAEGDEGFMGTIITAGSGQATVVAIGADTKLGQISEGVARVRPVTEFQKGLNEFSTLLAQIAGVTVVIIIVFNLILGRSMIETILFALTIAMGIAPELLPLVVTICLSHGARLLAKVEVVVKQLVSIEDLGNMEILCTDKTGTLTEGKILLSSYENAQGAKDNQVLDLALICNSAIVHKEIFGDSIDKAIWQYARNANYKIGMPFVKISEEPFNYEKRLASAVIQSNKETFTIYKGAPEAVLDSCYISVAEKTRVLNLLTDMRRDGMRVIAVAKGQDKQSMDFAGYISFSDTPKKNLDQILKEFQVLGVKVKILTGDSEMVTEKICREVGFAVSGILLGEELEKLSDEKLREVVTTTNVFAKVTPSQKARIIEALKFGGHTVGFLGDGVNDVLALHNADVGISVNSAVDVAKDAANIVLLKKSLEVIAQGIKEGRRTFANTIKYILMGTSSDFGNMVSAAVASLFLPFLPMLPVQVLLDNVLYDVSQLTIPTDNVDDEQLVKPEHWDLGYIKRFMLFFGPISSVYDFLTFGALYFVFKARNGMFQTGWFVESVITEILVVLVIRTQKVPFWKSRPSLSLVVACLGVVGIGLFTVFGPLGKFFEFQALPPVFLLYVIVATVTYLAFVELAKRFIKPAKVPGV
jgi:Mg2+-importing ATPase